MFRIKSNKKAFIIGSLVILLCIVCLTGATLALFTNDLHDGTIGIITTTGSVKVDIVDAETGESIVGSVLAFQTSVTDREIYFEPGSTYYTQGFKVKNIGSVPIKFRVYVSEDEDFTVSEINDAFDIWISKKPDSIEGAKPIDDFSGYLEVDAVSDDYYYLYVRMKETADNTFQGQTYSGIGVTVFAVQGNAEFADIKE